MYSLSSKSGPTRLTKQVRIYWFPSIVTPVVELAVLNPSGIPMLQQPSRSMQNLLHTEIMATLKSYNVTDRGQKAANLHMCRESKMPAVLTENLFIDVADDAPS